MCYIYMYYFSVSLKFVVSVRVGNKCEILKHSIGNKCLHVQRCMRPFLLHSVAFFFWSTRETDDDTNFILSEHEEQMQAKNLVYAEIQGCGVAHSFFLCHHHQPQVIESCSFSEQPFSFFCPPTTPFMQPFFLFQNFFVYYHVYTVKEK